jgi:leader peptidase (prepilin peptidase)/N-methyltransferase
MWLNMPVLSWLILRGKCANCHAPISARYPIVELLTGLLFTAITVYCFDVAGNPWLIPAYWVLISLFVAGTYIDIDHYILPDEITLGGTVAGLIASLLVPEFLGQRLWWENGVQSLSGAALGFGLLWLVVEMGKKLFGKKKMEFDPPLAWDIGQVGDAEEPSFTLDGDATLWTDLFFRKTDRLVIGCPTAEIDGAPHENVTLTIKAEGVSIQEADAAAPAKTISLEHIQHMKGTASSVVIPREAMGLGDVKFMGLVGAFLGWKGVLFTIFAGSILGSVVALILILARRREWAQRVPFGPYLAGGATLYLFFGTAIVQWYLSLAQTGADAQ